MAARSCPDETFDDPPDVSLFDVPSFAALFLVALFLVAPFAAFAAHFAPFRRPYDTPPLQTDNDPRIGDIHA